MITHFARSSCLACLKAWKVGNGIFFSANMAAQREWLTDILCKLVHGLDAMVRPACGTAVMLLSCAAHCPGMHYPLTSNTEGTPAMEAEALCVPKLAEHLLWGIEALCVEGHTRGDRCVGGLAIVWPRCLQG